ncbi:hypothetical protein B0T21DRAFT_383332 [Apiosordaria backusii]|uniref:Geranylgeranyl pyrophosphate synthetase n=1 Tax=Apiosordaria backusii TaxID=314023 RepID=A0AA40BNE8_9PEZI|nr:hypothetical protein B0T21DRAFT_383332 [Apiosordaria backusii]
MASHWYQPRSHYNRRKSDDVATVQASPPPPLGDLVQTLEMSDLDVNPSSNVVSPKIRDCRLITSYNWLDVKETVPTILVPGKPPLWTPVASPSRLNEDNGSYFRDKNAARFPKHPLEPCVIAALEADGNISSGIDVVACGSTLGNLLRFVRRQDKPFRILVEKIHNTVFFTRRENTPTELIPGVRGYGHSFPEANTIWEADVKGSASHQRLIRYTFGDRRFLVRFEADGYIRPRGQGSSSATITSSASINDQASLADLLSQTDMRLASKFNALLSDSTVSVKSGGELIPQAQVFDLKTRSIYTKEKKGHLAEELPRLWVSQIPTFILAFHTQGLFKEGDIQIRDVRQDVQRWEEDHQPELAQLAKLIDMITDIVTDMTNQKMELRYTGEGGLEVREQLEDMEAALSTVVKGRWEASTSHESENDEDSTDESGKGGNKHGDGATDRGPSGFMAEVDTDDSDDDYDHYYDDYRYNHDEDEGPLDYTACSAHDCGYCGKCSY